MSVNDQGHSLTLVKSHSDFKVKTCFFFAETVGPFGIKEIYTNELGHMAKMAAMPIYGKNLKKSSFPEAIDQ